MFFPALSHDFQERDSSGATPLWLAAKGTKCPASELQSDLAAEPAGEVPDPSPRSQNKFGKSMKIHENPWFPENLDMMGKLHIEL